MPASHPTLYEIFLQNILNLFLEYDKEFISLDYFLSKSFKFHSKIPLSRKGIVIFENKVSHEGPIHSRYFCTQYCDKKIKRY